MKASKLCIAVTPLLMALACGDLTQATPLPPSIPAAPSVNRGESSSRVMTAALKSTDSLPARPAADRLIGDPLISAEQDVRPTRAPASDAASLAAPQQPSGGASR